MTTKPIGTETANPFEPLESGGGQTRPTPNDAILERLSRVHIEGRTWHG